MRRQLHEIVDSITKSGIETRNEDYSGLKKRKIKHISAWRRDIDMILETIILGTGQVFGNRY